MKDEVASFGNLIFYISSTTESEIIKFGIRFHIKPVGRPREMTDRIMSYATPATAPDDLVFLTIILGGEFISGVWLVPVGHPLHDIARHIV